LRGNEKKKGKMFRGEVMPRASETTIKKLLGG